MFIKLVYIFYTILYIPIISTADESCISIILHGLGSPDGTYIANNEYLGRPDFYREDFFYNLFGSYDHNDSSYWEISSFSNRYPIYRSWDTAQHPVDIQQQWVIISEDNTQITIDAWCECVTVKTSTNVLKYIIISVLTSVASVLLVAFHVYIRRKRIRDVAKECVVCKKRTKRINSSIRRIIKPI